MRDARFAVTRSDGRTNTQVVCDVVGPIDAGQIVTYAALADALAVGSSVDFDRPRVQRVVRTATRSLEALHNRTLANVPKTGYRVALAREHMSLAIARQDKASRQIRRGLHILQHVRYGEMTDNERRAHEGHLILTSAIYQQQVALNARMNRAEAAIEHLLQQTTAKIEAG